MKAFIGAVALVFSGYAVQASTVPINLDARNWINADDPIKESQTAISVMSKKGVAIGHDPNRTNRSLNQNLAVVSDFNTNSPFSFSGKFRAPEDDDILGLLFGYQDGQNNFRFSWTGGEDADWEAGRTVDEHGNEHGYQGAMLVQEIGGKATTLAHLDGLFWQPERQYAFELEVTELGVRGSSDFQTVIDLVINSGSDSVFSLSANSGLVTDGRVGVFTRSNSALFWNPQAPSFTEDDLAGIENGIALIANPLPPGILQIFAAFGLLAFLRRRA
jgi:hypothetical protein